MVVGVSGVEGSDGVGIVGVGNGVDVGVGDSVGFVVDVGDDVWWRWWC